MSDDVLYRFIGPRDANGKPTEYVPGIPTRDLTAADLANIEAEGLTSLLKGLAIYEAVSPAKTKKAADSDSTAKEG